MSKRHSPYPSMTCFFIERKTKTLTMSHRKARDHARTPMHWDDSPNAGFCPPDVTPWMRVMEDHKTVNAAAQMADPGGQTLSPWQWWQRGLRDRKEHRDVFVYGDFEDLSEGHDEVYAYARTSSTDPGERWVVVLNFSGDEQRWALPGGWGVQSWVACTYASGKAEGKAVSGEVRLRPWEGLLGKVARG